MNQIGRFLGLLH